MAVTRLKRARYAAFVSTAFAGEALALAISEPHGREVKILRVCHRHVGAQVCLSRTVCGPGGRRSEIPETPISTKSSELAAALRVSWAPGTAVPSTNAETVELQLPAALHWMM